MRPLPPELLAQLADPDAIIRAAWAEGLRPDPERTVDEWADACRVVPAESGTPFPGPWSSDRVPYLREVMRCLSLSHPAKRITFKKSAQVGGSEAGVNLLGQVMAETPAPAMVVLPSLDDARDYNRLKLGPMIESSPAVRARVRDLVSRDETGSTVTFKKFPGGFLQVAGANSSKALQMRSVRVLVLEEISEYPWDVDGRGDPVALAEARQIAHSRNRKTFDCSTPAVEGACRVTALYDRSSAGRYMVACPHCQQAQALAFAGLRWPSGKPDAAEYHCASCGTGIAHRHKPAMVNAGAWVHERPELVEVHAGFAINALYSPFLSWGEIARKFEEARDSGNLKVFTQQMLGEPWKEQGEAPDHARLLERREDRPAKVLPDGVLFIVGACDVQGDRLEWDVWGFGAGLTRWLVDSGVVERAPTDPLAWVELRGITDRHYPDSRGRAFPIDAFGVDAGYASHEVYRFVKASAHTERIFALDGRGDPRLPPLSSPSRKDVDYQGKKIGAVNLWPVGTYGLKLEHYAAVRRTIAGPDADGQWPMAALRLPTWVDEGYCRQLVSEYLADVETRAGVPKREWRRIQGVRNERLDTAVYALALAHHLTDSLSAERWQSLAAERAADVAATQGDLLAWWTQRYGAATDDPMPAAAPLPHPTPSPPQAARREQPREVWIEERTDWL